MNPNKTTEVIHKQPSRLTLIVWVLGLGLGMALVAIYGFNVPVTTVFSYGLLVLMIGAHFFMHAGHGSHDHNSHSHQSSSGETGTKTHSQSDQRGGCH
ncbi:MAG: hypothetical protein ACNA8H_03710 [Anaerolineales bacterium]